MDPQRNLDALSSLSACWVQPAGPVNPLLIECSTLDNLTAPVYPSPTKFFPLKSGIDPRQLYEDCKRGLARCIYEHPHLSGVVIKDETGRNSIEIRPAPYAGTTFHYQDHRADNDMPSYEEFRNAGWPFADGDRDGLSKLRPKYFPCTQSGDPIVAPQFNVIKGGIVLTMSIAHAIGDLVQFMDFVRSWARNTCAVANARTNGLPEPPLPQPIPAHLMDRSMLRPNVQMEQDLDKLTSRAAKLPHMTLLDPRDAENMSKIVEELFTQARITDHDLANSPEETLRQLLCSVWTFPQSSIEELQRVAQEELPSDTRLSTIDCLTAFVWQRFFKAKWAPDLPGPDPIPETTRIIFAGSIRRRLTPPLPYNYMPACVDLFPVTVQSNDFASSSPDVLAMTAMKVRSSNNNWSEKTFHEMMEIAQAHPINPGIVPRGPIDALVTDHTRASASVLEDWGPGLGHCEALREPYLGREPPRGEVTFLPRWKDSGELDVLIAGEAVVLERLRKDKLMNAMASCQFVMDNFPKRAAVNRRTSKL